MLKNIKSSYFTKIIFSFVKEKQKLQLIKYNKKLQKGLNINLINYQLISKRYIIYESSGKGKGKEYNFYNDSLVYEGEYLNGRRNGKGKEFLYDKLIFNK